MGSEDQLRGQLDIVNERAFLFDGTPGSAYIVASVPSEVRALVAAMRTELVARIADLDDEVASLWLANKPVPAGVLKAAIRRATIANRFVPVIAGSAHRFVGVQPLLDAVVDYLPGPLDSGSVVVHFDGGTEGVIELNSAEPAAALVFKLVHDGQGRRMVFLRVYSGRLSKGDGVLNVRTVDGNGSDDSCACSRIVARTWKPLGRATSWRPSGWKDFARATPRVILTGHCNWNVRCSPNRW